MTATDWYAVGIITGLMALIALAIWCNLRPQMPVPPREKR